MKYLALLAAVHAWGADSRCAMCHKGHQGNAMATALYTVGDAAILKSNPRLEFQLGRFRYLLEREGDASMYTVSDGMESIRVALRYAFGQGFAGQTYVYQREGKWYESRLSFYQEIGRLDLTMGAPPGEPRNVVEAAGREMTRKDVTACFGCHTTNSVSKGAVDFERLQAGVGCESCHANTAAHLKSLAPMAKLSKWSAEEQSEACGRCHRTWADIAANGPRGVGNVRFQPYRLANSKCFDADDRRIGCTACHSPHTALERRTASYDTKCKACHSIAGSCPVGKADCASCHMPRYEIPGSHHLFTDHMIRIVRKNETYPN